MYKEQETNANFSGIQLVTPETKITHLRDTDGFPFFETTPVLAGEFGRVSFIGHQNPKMAVNEKFAMLLEPGSQAVAFCRVLTEVAQLDEEKYRLAVRLHDADLPSFSFICTLSQSASNLEVRYLSPVLSGGSAGHKSGQSLADKWTPNFTKEPVGLYVPADQSLQYLRVSFKGGINK